MWKEFFKSLFLFYRGAGRKGFTLIELIVVIAIIAVMSAVSLASFSVLTGNRLNADARKIVSELCWVRQLAVAGHQNYVNTGRGNYIVAFDDVNEAYTLYCDLNGNGVGDANEAVKTQNLSPDIDLAPLTDFMGAPLLPAQITFRFPAGTAQDCLVTLSSQGKTKQVSIFGNTGYVKIN